MKVQELLYESLKMEDYLLAYTIYWALQKGLLKSTDTFSDLRSLNINYEEVKELRRKNALNVNPISLWSLRKDEYEYVFIFADSEYSAKQLFVESFGESPISVVNADVKMDTTMWDKIDGYETFREMRERTMRFPHIIATYDSCVKTIEEVEREYCEKFGVTLRGLE